jgi:hypothetical protein
MTEADLAERLNELGYGPDDDLSHLHYALLPRIPDLDTAEGAKVICAIAAEVEAEVVVIDTIGRAVSGDENDAKTIQTFYRTTGKALKSAGRAWLRTDHSGKDVEKGQRGSSAKNDDVDVVWKLVRTDDGVLLAHNGVTRVSWVPEKIDLVRNESDDGVVSYKLRTGASWPAGTRECVDQLDRLGLPVDISKRKAAIALREAGLRVRNDVLNAAVRYRKQTLSHGVSNGDHLGDHPKTDMADWVTGTAGTTHQNTRSDGGDHLGDHRGPPLEDKWGPGPLSKEGTGHQPSTPNDWMTRLADKTSPPPPTPTIELDF